MILYLLMMDTPEDRSKFEKMYVTYRGLMYHVAYDILHNKQDAEDAVHHAFIKIAENIETIEDSIGPMTKSLVVTIVRNRAIDVYRHKQRFSTVDLDSCFDLSVEYNGNNTLTACMVKLPENYQTVLLLKHHHGYTSKEVAKIMGITESNVIKINQRAKKKLEVLCKEEGLL